MSQYKTIAESNNFIVLDKFTKYLELNEPPAVYQTEAALEKEFIQDLVNQGYENPKNLNTLEAMLANVRTQLQSLNNMEFSDGEWTRFVEEYLDKPSDNLVEKTRKIHDNYIYDFVFDDGHIQNIYLVDSTGRIRLTGNNRLHDNRSILQIEGLKDIADEILSRKKQDFQYSVNAEHYLLHVQYMPEVRLFLFVEGEENKAIADVRHALYLNLIVFVLVVLATIVLTNMMVSFYQKKLAFMATIDHLTQLMNRQAFEMFSLNMLADSRRSHTSLAVMMIDIDHFKKVNDTYGHAAGDKVLQEVAAILKHTVREADLVCRWGGEEFVVLLRGGTEEDAKAAYERFRTNVESYLFPQVKTVTVSLGFTEVQHQDTPNQAFSRADQGVYQAKHQGRNAFGFRNTENQRRRIRWACTRQHRRASAKNREVPGQVR